jgi:hypothetical protein
MAMTRTARGTLAMGLAAMLAACAQEEAPSLEPRADLDQDLRVPPDAAEQVEHLTALRALYDEDGEGFISPAEAAGYYRRHLASWTTTTTAGCRERSSSQRRPPRPIWSSRTRSWSARPSRNTSTNIYAGTTYAPIAASA